MAEEQDSISDELEGLLEDLSDLGIEPVDIRLDARCNYEGMEKLQRYANDLVLKIEDEEVRLRNIEGVINDPVKSARYIFRLSNDYSIVWVSSGSAIFSIYKFRVKPYLGYPSFTPGERAWQTYTVNMALENEYLKYGPLGALIYIKRKLDSISNI